MTGLNVSSGVAANAPSSLSVLSLLRTLNACSLYRCSYPRTCECSSMKMIESNNHTSSAPSQQHQHHVQSQQVPAYSLFGGSHYPLKPITMLDLTTPRVAAPSTTSTSASTPSVKRAVLPPPGFAHVVPQHTKEEVHAHDDALPLTSPRASLSISCASTRSGDVSPSEPASPDSSNSSMSVGSSSAASSRRSSFSSQRSTSPQNQQFSIRVIDATPMPTISPIASINTTQHMQPLSIRQITATTPMQPQQQQHHQRAMKRQQWRNTQVQHGRL